MTNLLRAFAPVLSCAVVYWMTREAAFAYWHDADAARIAAWYAGVMAFCSVLPVWSECMPVEPEPEVHAPAGFVPLANEGRVLIPTQDDGRAGWRFDVTPYQWSVLAQRLAHNQYSLPVNSLSVEGKPFGQKQIEQLRIDLVNAGLATKSTSGRVWLTERGRVFVAMQAPHSIR